MMMRFSMCGLLKYAAFAVLLLLSDFGLAQTQQILRLRLEPLSIRGRSGSPIPLQIKLEYNTPKLLEGDLILQVYNSYPMPDDLIATIRYEGIVLQGNDYIFNTVLPPFEHSSNKLYQIVCWFDTADGRMSLSRDVDDPEEPHELLSIGSFERATLIASASGSRDFLTARGNRAFLNNALSLDNYNPDSGRSTQRNDAQLQGNNQRIQNYTCSWDALSLPEDPLHLCSFDIVLLADGALGRLSDAQLKALQTWVEAGGSLCVLPDGNRLNGNHINFLQTLFETPDDPGFRLSGDDGTLLVISEEVEPVVNRYVGLGRATLLPVVDDLSTRLSQRELGQIVGHLWKVRRSSSVYRGENWNAAELTASLRGQGHKVTRTPDGYYIEYRNARGQRQGPFDSLDTLAIQSNMQYALQPKASVLASACETALMPEGVEMVPASVVAMLLIAYVLTVGPVDYFVLGYFRARKYTWLAFPVVTVIFTAITVNIAHQYMASSDTGGRMSVIDLIEDGRPVRQTDLQMHFYGSQTTFEEETTNAFVVPGQMIHASDNYRGQQTPRSINRTIRYAGRFPQSFRTEQDMRQWEPQINRRLTFAPEPEAIPSLAWDDARLVTTESGRRELSEIIQKLNTQGRMADAVVLHRSERHPLLPGNGFMFSDRMIREGEQWQNQAMQYYNYGYRMPPQDSIASLGVLESAFRINTRDYFSIVSQVSPQGSASLEDLPILDPTDDRQWLLIVAIKDGMNTNVYRRLYHIPATTRAESTDTLTPERNNE